MARWRRPGASEILLVLLLLATTMFIVSWTSHSYRPRDDQLPSFLVTVFLLWRVSRGGRISRVLLIIGSGLSLAVSALAIARVWDVSDVALVALSAAQMALLLSPPVYGRTRPTPVSVRARGWAQFVRRPPLWLLAGGLLGGVLVTLVCLGHSDFIAVPECGPVTSNACSAVAEGYPLHWLTADQNTPLIFKGALLKDFAQWALVSTSVLYLAWVWFTPRATTE